MREIKFRAWDSDAKKMYAVFWPSREQAQYDGLSVMQFTGLKDHAGKEIYEGDLVRRVNASIDKVDEIVYAADGYCAFMRRWPDGTLDWIHPEELKVVGNRWENPELLK